MDYTATLKRLCRLEGLDANKIIDLFKKEGVSVDVEKVDVGVPGFKIVSADGVYLVPERTIEYYNKNFSRLTNIQSSMLPYGIPLPLHLGEGELRESFYKAKKSEYPAAVDKWLGEIFEVELVAVYFLRYFQKSEALKEYGVIIFEAIESFYMGLDHVAMISLIPVFEGGLRNLQNTMLREKVVKDNIKSSKFTDGLLTILKEWGARRVSEYDWHPGKYGNGNVEVDFYTHICEQSDVINCFRLFFKDVLYESNYSGVGVNRHRILHMLAADFNSANSFYIMIIVLAHIAFIESLFNRQVPFFWQGYSDESRKLAQYLGQISALMDGRRDIIQTFGVSSYPKP